MPWRWLSCVQSQATLTYPAGEQGGILWSWWTGGRRPAPAGASHRHAAAGTEVLSESRGGEGNQLFSLYSTPKQSASKVSLMKFSWQVSASQTCSWSLPPASELKCRVQILAPEVLLIQMWVSRMPFTPGERYLLPWALPGGETWICRAPSFPAFGTVQPEGTNLVLEWLQR